MNPETHLHRLQSRRSVRAFKAEPVPQPILERLFLAATSAPSNTNRQPWRFTAVSEPTTRQQIVDAIQKQAEAIKTIIRQGHHAEDFGNYGDFFYEPLQTAATIIVPQYRAYPDIIANMIASGGGNPENFHTANAMQAELCSTSAAVMALLLQAHAEGLGACWMAGPTIARNQMCSLLSIEEPWQMVGAIAVGYPIDPHPAPKPRKPLDKVVIWR